MLYVCILCSTVVLWGTTFRSTVCPHMQRNDNKAQLELELDILYFLFTMLSYLTYFIGNEQRHKRFGKCCNRPKSSLLHSCIFPVAKYVNVVNVVITSISGAMAFLRGVGDVNMSLIRSVTNMHDLMCSDLLTHCHALCATHFFSLFMFHPFSPLLKKLLSLLKVLVRTPNNFGP